MGPVTLERTYDEPLDPEGYNIKILPGRYNCERTYFYGGGVETFEVMGVAGHSRLLFHSGNEEVDSEGCILVGQRFGFLQGIPAVLESKQGFGMFMAVLGSRQGFSLLVRNAA